MNYTVAIPAYNEEKRIEHLLSFLDQSCRKNVEILIINDGSKDKTLKKCERFKRCRIISFQHNQGYAYAINRAIQEAENDIIVFLDADSLPLPFSIEKLVKQLENPNVGTVTGSHLLVNSKKGIVNRLQHIIYNSKKLMDQYQYSRGNLWHLNGLIMGLNRKVISKVPNYETNQDALLGSISIKKGFKSVFVKDATSLFKAPDTVRDYINSRKRVCRGHIILNRKYCVSPHLFTEVRFPLYCSFLLRNIHGFRDLLAFLFGGFVDCYWRLYWILKSRNVRNMESYKWEQIESTKHW